MCQQLIGWKIRKLKIIEIKIFFIIYIICIFTIINIIDEKIMFPKLLGPICNNKKQLNND
jgi:hypothetical protein